MHQKQLQPFLNGNSAQEAVRLAEKLFIPCKGTQIKGMHHICAILETVPSHFHQVTSSAASEEESRNKPLLS